jgi:hypothetical protein
MERFLNGLLGRVVRDLVSRAVDWGFDRATGKGRADDPPATDRQPGADRPMTGDLAEKARHLQRMMRRLGR